MNDTIKRYLWNLLIAVDQLINTLAGGDPDETISSRIGKIVALQNGKRTGLYYFCKMLSLIDHRHCEKSIEHDEGSDQVAKR